MTELPLEAWPAFDRQDSYADARRVQAAVERCDFCAAAIDEDHRHVVNVTDRTLLCVCRPCSLLFAHDGAGGGRFRAVPSRYERLSAFAGAEPQWDALVGAVPHLDTLAPDVEALLVRRRHDNLRRSVVAREGECQVLDAYIVPIDACYELVGRIRRTWHGFQGGDGVWREVDEFFDRLARRASGTAVEP